MVHWAHTSEMADPYPYLLGGELLLSAGVHVPDGAGAGYFDAYVSRIVAAGGAALGFGVAPVHDTVPGALVEACEMHGLPLVEVPPRTTFSAVARALWQLMAQARTAELRRVTEAQQSLATAAARPDPVPSVLQQLARRLGGRAVLYGPEGTRLAGAGPEPGEEVRTALAKLAEVVRPSGQEPSDVRPSSASDTVAGTRLVAHALGNGEGFVLGTAAPQRDAGDHTIASVAAVLLSLLTGERHSGSGSRPLLRPGTAAAGRGARGGGSAARRGPVAGGARQAGRTGGAGPGGRVRAGRRPRLVPGGRGGRGGAGAGARRACGGSGAGLDARRQRGGGPRDWPVADSQAARALARARATRTPLLRHGDRPTALTDLVPPGEADAHARTLLAPIAQAPALVDTLRTWLSLHGSWDRTAVALDVHRNTVRQRITRCATLLDADLDDPDVRMELWFALRRT